MFLRYHTYISLRQAILFSDLGRSIVAIIRNKVGATEFIKVALGIIGVSDICLANAVILSYCMYSTAKIRINSEYSKYNEKYYSFARVYMIGKAENIPHSPHFPHPRWV